MDDLRPILDRQADLFEPAGGGLENVLGRARRRVGARRLLAGVTAIAVAGAGIGFAAIAFRPHASSHPASPPPGRAVSVSGTVNGIRCTATLPSNVLQAGRPTGMGFVITNVAGSARSVPGDTTGYVTVSTADGSLAWDEYGSFGDHSRPFPLPVKLLPGQVKRLATVDVVVAWPGTLTLHPLCGFGQRLPAIHASVVTAGTAPSRASAIDRALGRTGGLFADCVPAPDGSRTAGRFPPPDHGPYDPMEASCWAQIDVEPGFDVVTLRYVTPADAPKVPIPLHIVETKLPGGTFETGRWVFVVTANRTAELIGLQSAGHSVSRDAQTPDYSFDAGSWSRGSSHCGETFFGGGFELVSVCDLSVAATTAP